MRDIQQSIPIAAERRIRFTAVSSANLQTRLTGQAGFTVRLVKPDKTEAVGLGADPAQISAANEPGVYDYLLDVAEIAQVGEYTLHVSKAGMEPREIPFQVKRAVFGTAIAGTLASGQFTTDMTTALANHWKRRRLQWVTGTLAGQESTIAVYAGGTFVMVSGQEFTSAPAPGDIFEIL